MECTSNSTCDHGHCAVFNGSVVCICDEGFTGGDCDEDIDDCVGVVCQNGGSCVDKERDYACDCVAGYAGTKCSTEGKHAVCVIL